MKYCLFIAFILAVGGCENDPRTRPDATHSMTLLVDRTDSMMYVPPANKILQLFHCKETPNDECILKVKAISDIRLSPTMTICLPNAQTNEKENHEDDPQFRSKCIEGFYNNVRRKLTRFYEQADTIPSLRNTECYQVIGSELASLAAARGFSKTLVIVSDLFENSDLLDSYHTDLSSPTLIADGLRKKYPFPKDLHGIKIIFLFQPKNRADDIHFETMLEVYQVLLENTGAEVQVHANL